MKSASSAIYGTSKTLPNLLFTLGNTELSFYKYTEERFLAIPQTPTQLNFLGGGLHKIELYPRQ